MDRKAWKRTRGLAETDEMNNNDNDNNDNSNSRHSEMLFTYIKYATLFAYLHIWKSCFHSGVYL